MTKDNRTIEKKCNHCKECKFAMIRDSRNIMCKKQITEYHSQGIIYGKMSKACEMFEK